MFWPGQSQVRTASRNSAKLVARAMSISVVGLMARSNPVHLSANVSWMPPATTWAVAVVAPRKYESTIGPCRVSRTSSTSGSSRPRTRIFSLCTVSGSQSSLWNASRRCSSRRSRYRSWVSPPTLVNPHAWCDVWPITTPGENGSATPLASYSGHDRCTSNQIAGTEIDR